MLIDQRRDFVPVASVSWSIARSAMWADELGREVFRADGRGWDVGFHDRAIIPASEICVIRGIEFVFDQGAISMRLDGALLDYRNGSFVVENAAA
jgi:hypothetical protein